MKVLIVVCVLCSSLCASAQSFESPFQVSSGQEMILAGAGLGLSTAGYVLNRNMAPLTSSDLGSLSSNDVWAVDRFATHLYSLSARHLSDIGVASGIALSAVFLSPKVPHKEYRTLFIMGSETVLLTTGFTLMSKAIAARIRPYAYNTTSPLEERTSSDARQSFFSGHAAITSTACFFAAQAASQYDFSRTQKRLIWIGAATLPAFVGTMRVLGGKHFPTDVLTGYTVGALVGMGVPYLHQKSSRSLSLQSSLSGFRLTYQF